MKDEVILVKLFRYLPFSWHVEKYIMELILLLQISARHWKRCWLVGVVVGVTCKKVSNRSCLVRILWCSSRRYGTEGKQWVWERVAYRGSSRSWLFINEGRENMSTSRVLGPWLHHYDIICLVHSCRSWRPRIAILIIWTIDYLKF